MPKVKWGTCYSYLALETIFDENTNDTNIENDNAVTVVGDGTDIIVEDTIEDKDSSQKIKAPVALAEVDLMQKTNRDMLPCVNCYADFKIAIRFGWTLRKSFPN